MKTFSTSDLNFTSHDEQHLVYCGLDTLMTYSIYEAMKGRKNETYEYSLGLLGPALTMMNRGLLVDVAQRDRELPILAERKEKIKATLNRLAQAVWGADINHNSPVQLKEFFFEWLGIPKLYVFDKGNKKLSTGREVLEKIVKNYFRGATIANCILRLREIEKIENVLQVNLTDDNRFLSSYNVVGTETGRWSSSEHPLRYGSNGQNLDPALRHLFIADPGRKLAYIDLQGAEARAVAYLSGDENYIAGVEGGDVHSMTAMMCWGIEKEKVKEKFYRDLTYRDVAKRLAHGTNYLAKPNTIARLAQVDPEFAEDFQKRYFKAFPKIRKWQNHVITTLQRNGEITSPSGRTRKFWGRLWDESTWREAIAFQPQDLICTVMGVGLHRVWLDMEPTVWLHAQIHDAIIISIEEKIFDTTIDKVLEKLQTPIQIPDPSGNLRTMLIPVDCEVGWNWGKKSESNPRGITKRG